MLTMLTRCPHGLYATTMRQFKRTTTRLNQLLLCLILRSTSLKTSPKMTSKCLEREWLEWSWALTWQNTCKIWPNSKTDARRIKSSLTKKTATNSSTKPTQAPCSNLNSNWLKWFNTPQMYHLLHVISKCAKHGHICYSKNSSNRETLRRPKTCLYLSFVIEKKHKLLLTSQGS